MSLEFDKIDSWLDEPALKKETDFFLSLIDEIEKKAGGLGDVFKNVSIKIDAKDTGIKEMIDGVKKLELTSSNYQKVLAAIATEVDNLSEAQKSNLKVINDSYKEQEKARAGAKETVNLIKTEIAQTEKLEAGRTALAKNIALNSAQLKSEKLERDRLAKVINAENNSLEKSQAVIDLLINKKKKLNLETEQGRRVNEAFNKAIEKERDFILKNADAETKRIKNIGNYQGSAKIIVDALERARQKADQTVKSLGALSPEAQAATREFEGLKRITDQPQFLNIAAKLGDSNAELKFFVKQLNQLEDSGLKNSAVYKDVQARLAQLTDQIGDTRAEVKALSSDSRKLDLFASGVSFIADAFQTAAGAAALFGASEEKVQEVTKNLIAIQSVSNGFQGVYKQLTDKTTAANKLFAFSQTQVKLAMDATQTSAVRLKAALITTGIGALIVGVGYLISKLTSLGDESKDTASEVDILTTSFENQNRTIDTNIKNIQKLTQKRIDAAKISGKSEAEISNISIGGYLRETIEYNKQINERKKLSNGYYTSEGKLISENVNSAIDANRVISGLSTKLLDPKLTEKKKAELEASKKFTERLLEDYKKRDEALDNLNGKSRERRVKLSEDERKKDEDSQKKYQERLKKLDEERLKNDIDNEKRNAEAERKFLIDNLNARIKHNDEIINDDKNSLDAQLDALKSIFDAKSQLSLIEYGKEIEAEKSVEDGKLVIKEKTSKELLAAQNDYFIKLRELRIENDKQDEILTQRSNERQIEAIQNLKQNLLSNIEKDNTGKSSKIDIERNNQLLKLDEDFNNGKLKNYDDYNRRKENINKSFDEKELNQKLIAENEKLSIAIAFGDDTIEIEKNISDLKKQLSENGVKNSQEAADKQKKIEDGLKEKRIAILKEVETAIIELGKQFAENSFNNKIAEFDSLIAKNNELRDAEIDRINKSSLSESEKADKIALLNARTEAQNNELEKNRRKAEVDKAKFDKGVAIFQLSLELAKAIASLNVPKIIAAGAQLAIAIATPLPKFKDGKKLSNTYEGPGIWGEAGQREVKVSKDGTVEVSPLGASLTYVKKDDVIHSSIDDYVKTLQISAMGDVMRSATPAHKQEDVYAKIMAQKLEENILQSKQSNELLKTIANKKELNLTAKQGGIEAMWKYAASQIKYVNENCDW